MSPLRLDFDERGRRSRAAQRWDVLQLVFHMLRLWAFALLLMPTAFLASSLTAGDRYDAPDPGWYNTGSGWTRQNATGSGYDAPSYGSPYDAGGYGYDRARQDATDRGGFGPGEPDWANRDWGHYQSGPPDYGYPNHPDARGRAAYDRYRDPAEPWQRPDVPERIAPDQYGAPDWAQQPLPRSGDEHGRRPPPDADLEGYASGEQLYLDERDPWRKPAQPPAYRFREDPDLEQRVGGGTPSGYRFRPLTRKEQERHRAADQDLGFSEPDRKRRYQRRNLEQRGTAFGYAPGPPPPEDFYQRYFRSAP